ncbi:hypothetical protein E2C01_007548 [Portunus trituberculatus]|uniref:Uncharacterized protein n=1 Tax=Portunus trituberculatus TaxID=210409 RepID=A0A5B7D4H5_PORTR|nr:hypothetical protein [Portunus trituberculatus]
MINGGGDGGTGGGLQAEVVIEVEVMVVVTGGRGGNGEMEYIRLDNCGLEITPMQRRMIIDIGGREAGGWISGGQEGDEKEEDAQERFRVAFCILMAAGSPLRLIL